MWIEQTIRKKIETALEPFFLEIINESFMHRGPATESHFKVTIVTQAFKGQRLLQRHRTIHALLSAELADSIHALALHTYTPEEWQQQEKAPESPPCKNN